MSATTVPRIHKLDEVVINRIAAGEVVQKPSAAVKEMLENSIDAGSTAITITAKAGGMEFLQIQDNGHGIQYDDLPILCERFTTSKLSHFDDLKSISTFGFRGEALASITHVANVTILTRTSSAPCAYKAKYSDGKLVPLKPGDRTEPKPCAGVVGTTITVEDLFHNMPARKQAFKNYGEQYQKILDVVTRYSIHYANRNIAFTCKKQGQMVADLHTPNNSTVADNIRVAFGHTVAQELLDFELKSSIDASLASSGEIAGAISPNDNLCFSVLGKISNANYSSKKSVFILFVNNRLVENNSIKKAVEAVYADLLPKHSHPFCYFSLELPAENVDVNVHPTKKEVHFLHEESIVAAIYDNVSIQLRGANSSRVFRVLATLPASLSQPSGSLAGIDKSFEAAATDNLGSLTNEDLGFGSSLAACAVDNTQPTPDGLGTDSTQSVQVTPSTAKVGGFIKPLSSFSADYPVLLERRPTLSAFAGSKRPAANVTSNPPSTSAPAIVLPAHKFVRTDPSQQRISDLFRPVEISTDNSQGGVCTSVATSTRTRHRPGCFLLDLPYCGVISNSSSELATDVLPGESSLISHQCSCCATANDPDATLFDNDMVPITTEATKSFSQSSATEGAAISPALTAAQFEIIETSCQYDSIRELLQQMKSQHDQDLSSILRSHTFVGIVDSTSCLVQVGLKLVLIDYAALCRKLYSQLVIRQFGEMAAIRFESPISIVQCLTDYFTAIPTLQPGQINVRSLVDEYVSLLQSKAEMLQEYFNIGINEMCELYTLPLIVPGFLPDFSAVPMFLALMCNRVNWDDEVSCFQGVADQLGVFYSYLSETKDQESFVLTNEASGKFMSNLYPCLRKHLIPAKSDNAALTTVASLEDLYKVFERC